MTGALSETECWAAPRVMRQEKPAKETESQSEYSSAPLPPPPARAQGPTYRPYIKQTCGNTEVVICGLCGSPKDSENRCGCQQSGAHPAPACLSAQTLGRAGKRASAVTTDTNGNAAEVHRTRPAATALARIAKRGEGTSSGGIREKLSRMAGARASERGGSLCLSTAREPARAFPRQPQ